MAKRYGRVGSARQNANAIIEDVECVFETPKSIRVKIAGLEEEYWIPKSQLAPHSPVSGRGDEGQLIIPKWLADKKELPIG